MRQDGAEILHYEEFSDDDHESPELMEWVMPILKYNRKEGVYVNLCGDADTLYTWGRL